MWNSVYRSISRIPMYEASKYTYSGRRIVFTHHGLAMSYAASPEVVRLQSTRRNAHIDLSAKKKEWRPLIYNVEGNATHRPTTAS